MKDGTNIRAIRADVINDLHPVEGVDDNTLMNDPRITRLVFDVWNEVFKASNEVLLHAERYGYSGMTIVPDPNIHGILEQVKVMSRSLDTLSVLANGGFDYDENRLLLNAREQMTRMERLALALTNDKRGDFDVELALMKSQAVF